MVTPVLTTGQLRPRRFTVPLPTDHALCGVFTQLFTSVMLDKRAVLTTSDGDDDRRPQVLGLIDRVEWLPDHGKLVVDARCDRIMDHGVWVFYRLMMGIPSWLADGYSKLAMYGKRHAAPGMHYEDGVWEPTGDDLVVDELLVPDTTDADIAALDVPHINTLTGIVLLPQSLVPGHHVRRVVAIRWDDTSALFIPPPPSLR